MDVCKVCGQIKIPTDSLESPISGEVVSPYFECPNDCERNIGMILTVRQVMELLENFDPEDKVFLSSSDGTDTYAVNHVSREQDNEGHFVVFSTDEVSE